MAPLSAAETWRQTGYINAGLVFCGGFALLICLILSTARGNGSLTKASIILSGSCEETSNLNLFLHLLINIVSSGVLASSNYFMQVVSAPSRTEIDSAHADLKSLEIGIPSINNVFHVSRFKALSYFILFFSSIPIHLFFNSAVFETKYQGSSWQMTIATEAFVNGTPFYPPGASLSLAGQPIPMSQYATPEWIDLFGLPDNAPESLHPSPAVLSPSNATSACGVFEEASKYTLASSCGFGQSTQSTYENLNGTVSQISAPESTSWQILDPIACLDEYSFCNPRKKHRDVVMIVSAPSSQANGWSQQDVFGTTSANYTSLWDSFVPAQEQNPLWYSTQCGVTRSAGAYSFQNCTNECAILLGRNETTLPASSKFKANEPALIPVTDFSMLPEASRASLNIDALTVEHCYTRVEQPKCKVGVSNILILIVTICFFIKSAQCGLIIWKLPHLSLVTPGDAVESFIIEPDQTTFGLCTLDLKDSLYLQTGFRYYFSKALELDFKPGLTSRKFSRRIHRLSGSFPNVVWKRTYFVFLCATVPLTYGFVTGSGFGLYKEQSFGPGDANLVLNLNASFISSVIFANSPQLLLSFCYFIFNTFFTRLQVEKEWNSYGASLKPLRVSYARGGQVSTYRLQLPYKWIVPLISLSVLLHWLLSSSLFIFISEGGYWTGVRPAAKEAASALNLGPDAIVAVGYSQMAIVVLYSLSMAAMTLPIFFSREKVHGNMVVGGSDSLVLSAACHCFPQGRLNQTNREEASKVDPKGDGYERIFENDEMAERLYDMAQAPVRWGAMESTDHLRSKVTPRDGVKLMHLGFGDWSNNVRKPEEDEWYA